MPLAFCSSSWKPAAVAAPGPRASMAAGRMRASVVFLISVPSSVLLVGCPLMHRTAAADAVRKDVLATLAPALPALEALTIDRSAGRRNRGFPRASQQMQRAAGEGGEAGAEDQP